MVSAKSLKRDFTVLDKHVEDLAKRSAVLKDLSDMNDEVAYKKFVNAVRSLYDSRQKMIREAVKEKGKIQAMDVLARDFDNEALNILDRMREGHEFIPKRLEHNIKKGLDAFLGMIYFMTSYHHSPGEGFHLMCARFGKRKNLLKKMHWTLQRDTVKGVFREAHLNGIMQELEVLIDHSYDWLQESLQQLDKLFGEYETGLQNAFVMTERLHFISGVEVKKKGFWAALFGKTEFKNIGIITAKDRHNMPFIQRVMAQLHDDKMPLIRAKQEDVVQKVHALRNHELRLMLLLGKAMGKKRKVRFAKAA
ncbi:hypothetical protein ACFL3V_02835 [Nanoarchaeota archaeon]